jgi:hypothetical protein
MGVKMLPERRCSFYRDSVSLSVDRGLGYCDLDCDRTTCNGYIQFCEKAETLKRYLIEKGKGKQGLDLQQRKKQLC